MGHNFKDSDAKRLQKLMQRIVQEASFNLSINEFVEIFNELDWVNKDIVPKIQANVFEINKVVTPPQEDIPEKKPRAPRAKKK